MKSQREFIAEELEHSRREARMMARHLSSGDCERAAQSLKEAALFGGSAMRSAIRAASQDKSESLRRIKIETYEQDQAIDALTGSFVMACVRR
jgi:hypothetical protein